jgi:hypothetical protein
MIFGQKILVGQIYEKGYTEGKNPYKLLLEKIM